ncbi:T9SS type A sorting domain-containing protein [Moheibacter sediminis]|uniref:Por secretion system C-terminal sorting domain-containing protein n=1 Tax=Moheibacter sediminis TaxID=1434700 RepID=A0A1W1YMM3_9FLAO|nr:T9SS type A sorting domain-containing protein [Moheibacter sediminis]SMC37373.1 Por secretion system C-terminal sorting domain-containing protein [Moheibacter sediminis]
MRNFLFILLFISIISNAQYGVLDPSFGNNGISIQENNLPEEVNARWSRAMTLDQDQNIYTGTNYNYNSDLTAYNDNILISKFSSTGELDNSFAENGFKKINIENGSLYVYDMLNSHDNYIYVLGGVFLNSTNERKTMVVKLDRDGNFMSDFGDDGIALFSVERGSSGAVIVETTQNEFLIGGNYFRNDNSNPGLLLMKMDANGAPVSSFGNAGFLKHNYSDFDVLRDLKLYEDGGFQVLDFNSDNLMEFNYILMKFNSDGTLDTSFNQTGTKVIPLSNDNLYDFSSIELKNNENIILSSNGFDGGFYYMNLTEYLSNGNINANFGNNGSISTYLNNIFSGSYLHLQKTFMLTPDDQNIIQIGYAFENQDPFAKFALVAFDGSGNYDNQFGTNAVSIDKIHPSLNDEPTKALFMGNDHLLILNGTHLSLVRYTIYDGLSIEDISKDSKIQIAPNPASNSFIINGLNGTLNQVYIIDLTGKTILEFSSVQNNQTLNLGSIPKGIYIIKINSKNKTETKKLIVK